MRRCLGTLVALTLAASGLAAQQTSDAVATAAQTPVSAEQVQAGSEQRVPPSSDQPAAAPQQPSLPEGAEPGDSHVRIVRLSDRRGTVAMDRAVGKGAEIAIQNMPITQGMALATGKDSFAEVEFEDGSTLRLAPNTEVSFVLLALRSSGAKASTIMMERGTVYVSLQKAKDSEFTLGTGKSRIAVAPGTHLRLDLTTPKPELAVISGQASLLSDGAPLVVGKKQTLALDHSGASQPEVAKGIYESAYDGWDQDAVKYHDHYMKTSNNLASTAMYGVSDLNYYGSFGANSCGGSFWQPYFVSAGWSPYSNGMWALYGSGYSWVSPYPWGWLPFHTGAWSFCPGTGWGWNPGGAWYGLRNVALLTPSPVPYGPNWKGPRDIVHAPGMVGGPRPPVGRQSMVAATNGPMVRSMMDRPDNFVFRRDSAGMGVPRGALGNLNGIAHDVNRHGFANREVFAEPMSPAHSMMMRGNGGVHPEGQAAMPMTIRRGPTPEGMGAGGDRFGWKNAQGGQPSNAGGNPGQHTGVQGSGSQQGAANHGSWQGGGGGGQPGGWKSGGGAPSGGMGGGAGRASGPSGSPAAAGPHH